jgi:hypothetical protein
MTREKAIKDGFGNRWLKCEHSECDLQVVRPGKVRCSGFCEGESKEPTEAGAT